MCIIVLVPVPLIAVHRALLFSWFLPQSLSDNVVDKTSISIVLV